MLLDLGHRIDLLPEPHRTNAMGNLHDALDDLIRWPEHRIRILADLERAIEAHEAERGT